MPHGVVRARPGEKGGSDTASATGSETADHRSERGGRVAEPLCDQLERLALHEDRAEGLVLAMEGLLGFEEELTVVASLHDAGSLVLLIFGPGIAVEHRAKIGSEPGSTRPPARVGPQETGRGPLKASRQLCF
jgi:hypothetical protein